VSGNRLRRLALIVAAVTALAIHYRIFTAAPPNPEDADGKTYLWPARSLAAGRGFLTPNPVGYCFPDIVQQTPDVPDTVRTPGYPLLIAAVIVLGLPLSVIVAAQHLLAVTMAITVFLVADRVTGRWPAALAAAAFFVLFPPLARNAGDSMPRFAIPFAAPWAIAFGAGVDALFTMARSRRSAAPTPPPARATPPRAPRRPSRP
jgi:hypothetical protein